MVRRDVITNFRTRKLARRLSIELPAALGYLEALWQAVAKCAPAGDIGRLSNQDIALEMWYEGDADELIDVLVQSGWLVEDTEHRLIAWEWMHHSGLSKRSRRWIRMKAAGGDIGKAQRNRIYARDGFACLMCGRSHDLSVDHWHPVSKGGTNADENLQTLCRACNGAKKDRLPAGVM